MGAHFLADGGSDGALMLPLSVGSLRRFGSGRDARYCHATITKADATEIEANLEVLDERGDVVLEVTGLRMGTGTTKAGERERVLAERLLTVGWEQRQPPADVSAGAGEWLLITLGGAEDELSAELSEALTVAGARCRTARADGSDLTSGDIAGVVVLTSSARTETDAGCPSRGRELVEQVVRIARVLSDTDGQPPRLYVVTRNAQAVTPHDRLNLDQGGLRGLLRVIGSEQPVVAAHPDRRRRTHHRRGSGSRAAG